MANIGKALGKNYITLMPDLTDVADVQQALEMYHMGYADYNPTIEPAANSIEGHLADLQDQIDFNASTISGGGETKTTEPTLTPTGQPIPDGYVWVDKDANANTVLPTYPPAVYSSVEPLGWGTADKGRIWINESVDTMVLNPTVYLLKTEATSTYQTIAAYNSSIQSVIDSSSASTFMLMGC